MTDLRQWFRPVEPAAGEALQPGCRLAVQLRLLSLVAAILAVPSVAAGDVPTVRYMIALVLGAGATWAAHVLWTRAADLVAAHAIVMFVDLGVSVAILLLTGTNSPFTLYTVVLCASGAFVFDVWGAIVWGSLTISTYLLVEQGQLPFAASGSAFAGGNVATFDVAVATPMLFAFASVAGVGGRRLVDRGERAASRARESERLFGEACERARLAREMHDSIGKTAYGIAMQAVRLERRIGVDPAGARQLATSLAADARVAAAQARALVNDLREEEAGPLLEEVRTAVAVWCERTGTAVQLLAEEGLVVESVVQRELLAILSEALVNVERHAHAQHVTVEVRSEGPWVSLAVIDDGVGTPAGRFIREQGPHGVPKGHFGILGMRERAEVAGGSLTLEGQAGQGTQLRVRVPRRDAAYVALASDDTSRPYHPERLIA